MVSSPYGKLVSNCGLLGRPPAIIAQTPSQIIPAGTAASLSVACSGTSLMFWQWYSNGVPISTASPANQGNLITAGRGTFTVIASNAMGASAMSAPMTLTDGSANVFSVDVSQGVQGAGSYAVGVTNVPIAVPAYYASAEYPVFDHWNPPWLGGATGVTCSVSDSHAAQTVAVFSGNLTNLIGKTVSFVPIYRSSKSWLTVVNGLGSGHYDFNVITNVDIMALPDPPGYRFDHWESSAAIQAPLSRSTKVTLTNGQTVVNAIYASTRPSVLNADRSGPDITVQWSAVTGLKYTLQVATNLANSPAWTDIAPTNRPGPAAAPWSMTGTNLGAAALPLQFYRVRANP